MTTPHNKISEDVATLQSVADGLGPNPPHSGLVFSYKTGIVRDDNALTSVAASGIAVVANDVNYVEVSPNGIVSTNLAGFTSGNIPMAIVFTGPSTITSVQDVRTTLFASATDQTQSFMTWTTSGATTTSGTTVYSIPVAAQGKLSVLAGNGQIFYDSSTYTLNLAHTQLTFNTVNDVPLTGSKLEFFYSDVSLSSGILGNANPLALGTADEGISANASREDHVHPTTGLLVTGNLSNTNPNALGAANSGGSGNVSRADHVHPTTGLITTSDLASTNPLALGTAAPGVSTEVSRKDHVHPTTGLLLTSNLSSSNPADLGTASPGISTNVSRFDHVHPTTGLLLTGDLSNANPQDHAAVADPGVSGDVSRADHTHSTNGLLLTTDLSTQPGLYSSGDGEAGTSTSVAREDHQHPIAVSPASVNSGPITLDGTAQAWFLGGGVGFVVNLPPAGDHTGRLYYIKSKTTGTFTITPDGSETIDGAATLVINAQYQSYTIISDGNDWMIV